MWEYPIVNLFLSQASWKKILTGHCAGFSCTWWQPGEDLLWVTSLYGDSTANEESCECSCILPHLGERCLEKGHFSGGRGSARANSFAATAEESEGLCVYLNHIHICVSSCMDSPLIVIRIWSHCGWPLAASCSGTTLKGHPWTKHTLLICTLKQVSLHIDVYYFPPWSKNTQLQMLWF